MTSDSFTCPHCGQNLSESERSGRFCPKCGKEINPGPTLHASAVPPPPVPPSSTPQNSAGVGVLNYGKSEGKAAQVLDYGKRVSLTWWQQAHKAFAKIGGDIHISTAE